MQVDREGNGMLTPEAIALFLDDLGLEPTEHDVKLIMRELDPRQEGYVTREDFMQFIRNGGRRKRPAYAPSLEKRLSIELDADKLEAANEGAASKAQLEHAMNAQSSRMLSTHVVLVDFDTNLLAMLDQFEICLHLVFLVSRSWQLGTLLATHDM